MILLFPYSTDSPVYHLPFATGGIIAVNVVVFFATTFQMMVGNVGVESLEPLLLQFDTINPLQWISNAFMHAGLMHLLGNMFFLWAFGLVIEGKIGSLPFLVMYFFIAAVDGAAVQLPMFLLGSEGAALGASGVIFALMVVAMLWAPENEMDCFYIFFIRIGTFEARIVALGIAYLMMQVAFLFLVGFSMSSEMLHMVGALIGLPVGLAMLRMDWVDCEGWDAISRNKWLQDIDWLCSPTQRQRMQQKKSSHEDPVRAALALAGAPNAVNPAAAAGTLSHRKPAPQTVAKSGPAKSDTAKSSPAKSKSRSGKSPFFGGKRRAEPDTSAAPPPLHPDFNRLSFLLRQAIQSKAPAAAQQPFVRLEQLGQADRLADETLLNYVQLLASRKLWNESIRPLMILSGRGGDHANRARLRLAQIQWRIKNDRPAAVAMLQGIRPTSDPPTATDQKFLQQRDEMLRRLT